MVLVFLMVVICNLGMLLFGRGFFGMLRCSASWVVILISMLVCVYLAGVYSSNFCRLFSLLLVDNGSSISRSTACR